MSIFALGGNAGFAIGSLVTTPVLLVTGLRGTWLLVLPGAVGAIVLLRTLGTVLDGRPGRKRSHTMPSGDDDWPAFLRLTTIVVLRSIMFFGITSFVALYFIQHLGVSAGVGGAALTVFLFAGASGTLLGGWLADRLGRVLTIRIGFAAAVPGLLGLVLAPNVPVAFAFVVLTGLGTFIPFSVFVVLGQDYLPNRIGTASGVTVGLGVSIGGLFSPLLGWLADGTSLRVTLSVLIAVPIVAIALSGLMRDAAEQQELGALAADVE